MASFGSRSVNWQQLIHELDWSNDARRDELVQQRLRQRAEQYAQHKTDADKAVDADYVVLTFALGKELYGVDVMLVRNVRTISKLTPVPGTPRFYPGVVNIRGKVLTVLDLRLFFEMNTDNADKPVELIVVNVNALEIGILAHHVHDVVAVSQSSIEALDDVRYARGMAPGRVILLDFARMFEDERLIVGGIDD